MFSSVWWFFQCTWPLWGFLGLMALVKLYPGGDPGRY